MATPLRKCSAPGCRELIREGSRCEKHQQRVRIDRRETSGKRGYDYRWQKASGSYRDGNPLCVECLFRERVKAAQCVDHIIPHTGRDELMWDHDNWCSLCWGCHARKTRFEQDLVPWEPKHNRIVICGLPGVGKTWRATELSVTLACDVFDWDAVGERFGINTRNQITEDEHQKLLQERKHWLMGHRYGAAVMIVGRPRTALEIAAKMEARVMHLVCDVGERDKRLRERVA